MDQAALAATFRRIIIANELDNDLGHVHKFSDPDGVRSGKSGWSFGISQFDLSNNPVAAHCLRKCGFTEAEIAGLKDQTINVRPLESKLKAAAETIAHFDDLQLNSCVSRSQRILSKHSITPVDAAALLAVADYDNQYHLSDLFRPGYLIHYLAKLARPFTAKDVLDFKVIATKYGREHKSDCQRRYDNLVRIMKA